MISLATTDDLSRFACDNSFITEIISNTVTYSDDVNTMTWLVDVYGVIQKVGDVAVIYNHNISDFTELNEFIQILGIKTVFTDKQTAKSLDLNLVSSGVIMRKTDTSPPQRDLSQTFFTPDFPEYSKIYALLSKCEFTLPQKDDFIADFVARLRAKTARILCNDDYSAICFTGYEIENSAIISAVAVLPEIRKNGFGSAILQQMCGKFKQKNIFLYRESNKNEHFYIENGFKNVGEYVELS